MTLRAVMLPAGWNTAGSATNNIETEHRFCGDWLQKDDYVQLNITRYF